MSSENSATTTALGTSHARTKLEKPDVRSLKMLPTEPGPYGWYGQSGV